MGLNVFNLKPIVERWEPPLDIENPPPTTLVYSITNDLNYLCLLFINLHYYDYLIFML
jgi:hypothetical protein